MFLREEAFIRSFTVYKIANYRSVFVFAKILNEGRIIIFWRYYFLLWTKQHVRLVKELELH